MSLPLADQAPQGRWRAGLAFLLELLVPVALYYGLRAAEVGGYLALIAAAVAPVAWMAVRLVQTRRLDGIAAFFNTMTLLALGVSLIGGGQRFLLAREGWTMGIVGLWFLLSTRTANPLALRFSRPLLEGLLNYGRGRWDILWKDEPRFRHIWRVASVIFGIGTLGDAAARITMAYTLPVDLVPALSTALYAATSATLLVLVNIYYVRSGLWLFFWGKNPADPLVAATPDQAQTAGAANRAERSIDAHRTKPTFGA